MDQLLKMALSSGGGGMCGPPNSFNQVRPMSFFFARFNFYSSSGQLVSNQSLLMHLSLWQSFSSMQKSDGVDLFRLMSKAQKYSQSNSRRKQKKGGQYGMSKGYCVYSI